MRRWLTLLKNAWLIVWNVACMAVLWGVPLVALYQGRWLAAGLIAGGALVVWLVKHPSALLGLWLSLRR